jgi:mono/diheme cytochrome c family protein
MLSTIELVVAGLSTSHKIGLVVVAAAFIIFALVSSFVLPRRNPNFPGKHIGWFVAVAVCFFVAMLAAVIVFGREAPEASGEGTTTTATAPATTTTATTTTSTSTTASGVTGDPAAGKAVFASAGCSGCHTLKAAGATGNVGPNLDQLKPAEDVVKNQVIHGGGAMPAFGGQLSAAQIQNVAAYVYVSTHS